MNVPVFIAGRYLTGKHRIGFISFISYVSIIGLAIGVAALCLTLFILDGFEREIKNKVIAFDAHIRVKLFYDQPMAHVREDSALIRRIPGIRQVAPYVQEQGMIRSAANTDGVLVEGVSPRGLFSTLRVHHNIIRGSADLHMDSNISPMIIGNKLARNLEVDIGDRVYIFTMRGLTVGGRQPRVEKFRITGIYESGMSDYDDIFVYTHIKSAQRLFEYGSGASGFLIETDDPFNVSKTSAALVDSLGFPYFPLTWQDRHQNLFKWLNVQKYPILIVFGLILIVAVFNIVSTLIMIVLEKEKDIGVLRSMGLSIKKIVRIFTLQGAVIGIIGSCSGTLLALGLAWLQIRFDLFSLPPDVYFMDKVPILIQWPAIVIIMATAILLSILATVYPSFKISKSDPAEAVRYE